MGDGYLRFPLFIDLRGKRAVVVGGGTIALRRAAALLEFGAEVTVVAPERKTDLPGANWLPRAYRKGDLSGAFLAVAATDDGAVNAAVGEEARADGIWFNRADRQEDCDFFFPAVCRGEGVVAGVMGDGSDHARTARAAKKVRSALEEIV